MATDKPGVLEYRKAINDVITSRYARLSQTLNSSMETFARHMIEVKLIDRGVMRSLNYDDIMEQFMSAMEFKHSIPELQEHCQLFIGVLEKLDGAPRKAADEFATAWSHLEPGSYSIQSSAPSLNSDLIKSNPVVDLVYEKIEEVQELAEIAHKLKERFSTLYITVRQSLVANNIDLSVAKELLCLSLEENRCLPKVMESCMKKLEKVENIGDFFVFLIKHHFIGYLNYALLRKISRLANDSTINNQFEQYEQECTILFNKASFKNIMEMFRQYPDLKPSTAIGLPHIVFQLDRPWLLKRLYSWITTFSGFSWSNSASLNEIRQKCVLITYAVLPSVIPAVLKDLRDPAVLKELEDVGVTVVQLPDVLKSGNESTGHTEEKDLQVPKISQEEMIKRLYGAVVNGDVVQIIQLIKDRIDINSKFYDESGVCRLGNSESLLHLAVDAGRHNVLFTLINQGADVNIVDKTGKTALYYAIEHNYSDMVQTLLDHGATINKTGGSYLHYFVEQRKTKEIQNLLSKGVNGDLPDKFGDTPLHCAINFGYNDIVEVLLKHGVNPRGQNKEGWSPLYLAAMKENITAFQHLLDHGVKMKEANSYLHYAAMKGHTPVFRSVLKYKVTVDILDEDKRTPLHIASDYGSDDITEMLLQHRAKVNAKDKHKKTPLHYAAEKGHNAIVEILIKYKADVNCVDEYKYTPLHNAASNHYEVVSTLLSHNAKINAAAKDGWTALNQAAWNGQNRIVELLLSQGADPNIVDKEGWGALRHAAKEGHSDVIQTLINHGVDLSVMDEEGWTILHVAAQRGYANVVDVLLKNKFNVNAKDENGWSAFNCAIVKGHPDVVRTMIEYGADINVIEEEDGKTSIHHAVDSLYKPGRVEVVEILLKNKADPNAVDDNGTTPLHYAVNRGYPDVVQVLLKYGADVNIQDDAGETPMDQAIDNKTILELFGKVTI